MSLLKFKRSSIVMPLSLLLHLTIINCTLYFFTPETYLHTKSILYYNICWLIVTLEFEFYTILRKEKFQTNIRKILHVYISFGLLYFVFFVFNPEFKISIEHQVSVYFLLCLELAIYRWLFFWLRGKYRFEGGNSVQVVGIGRDKNLKKIRRVFDDPNLGYRYKGFFDDGKSKSPTYLGKVADCFLYILENDIDEIYCIASKFSNKELQNLINFADNNLIKIKIIPDNKNIFTRAMTIEMYDDVPVLNIRKVPLETTYAKVIKRIFDIIFSTLVILLILSWLTPILFVLVKLESPGPLFFRQKRHGLKRKVFWCYKFRSMTNSLDSNKHMTTKNDLRVTKIGRILRKTSIDELPQFFNVFMGSMSVVGPRPHMEYHTMGYETSIDKYLVRHFVKPGITGLAQVRGYRGEITVPSDIVNRIRLDIFYVEKWSLFLDVKIIFYTVYNTIVGDDNAY
ncbi:undecaprenyl-phosphate glucose phosphotransferase [Kriegella sp. EG-1]|nr:undecaprenyl-phosphate glucose phosphotransferase [Flavobacteriaceae bacterium EG-1]